MKHTEYIIPIGDDAQDYDEMFIGVIRRQPELVRCKDCKHMGDVYLVRLPWLEQKEHRCRYWEHPTTPDEYCSRAERREE